MCRGRIRKHEHCARSRGCEAVIPEINQRSREQQPEPEILRFPVLRGLPPMSSPCYRGLRPSSCLPSFVYQTHAVRENEVTKQSNSRQVRGSNTGSRRVRSSGRPTTADIAIAYAPHLRGIVWAVLAGIALICATVRGQTGDNTARGTSLTRSASEGGARRHQSSPLLRKASDFVPRRKQ